MLGDLIDDEDEDYLECEDDDDYADYRYNSYSCRSHSLSSQQHNTGCQLSVLSAHSPRPMRKACGRVRGLGRNRQTVLSSQNRADFVALELELGDSRNMQRMNEAKKKRKIEPWCFPVSIMGILVILIIFLPFINPDKPEDKLQKTPQHCSEQCRLVLVESIPRHLKFPKPGPILNSIYSTWMDLITSAEHSIDIASFYWELRAGGPLLAATGHGPSHEGERIFKELVKAGLQRKVKIRIAQSLPDRLRFPDNDSAALHAMGAAEVRSLNFTFLLGSGVLHTKFWLVDQRHFWIGSANMDWRSLSEVKELGIAGFNCSCLAKDLSKIFNGYWYLGATPTTTIPSPWPASYSTLFNMSHPLLVPYNGASRPYATYISSSPPAFCPDGRAFDINALLSVMSSARKFVYISVMDYTPVLEDQHGKSYWPVIDDAIRDVAFDHGVNVRLLVSKWNHTNPLMINHLRSLLALNGAMRGKIEIRWFYVPAFTPVEERIPFARVNHCKYMLTETCAFIGTSNWEGDYFVTTAGVSIILNDTLHQPETHTEPQIPLDYSQKRLARSLPSNTSMSMLNSSVKTDNFTTIRDQLQEIFLRDWNSKYTSNVTFC